MVLPLWKTVHGFSKNYTTTYTYDPVISLLGMYQRELKTHVHKKIYTNVKTVLFITAKRWKQANVHQQMNGQTTYGMMALLFNQRKE